jgi:hypothetical protein
MQAIEARNAMIEVSGPNGETESVTLEEARDRCLSFLET